MTHHSSVRYGGGRAFCDNGSCARSGPLRVSYFAVTVDGKAYESIAEAARREHVSPHTLRMARKMGWTCVGRRYVSFG